MAQIQTIVELLEDLERALLEFKILPFSGVSHICHGTEEKEPTLAPNCDINPLYRTLRN